MPRTIRVIQSEITRGLGNNPKNPCRIIQQYFLTSGEFLAENDPLTPKLGILEINPNELFFKSPVNGAMITVTAIAFSLEEANLYLETHHEQGVLSVFDRFITIALNSDLGVKR